MRLPRRRASPAQKAKRARERRRRDRRAARRPRLRNHSRPRPRRPRSRGPHPPRQVAALGGEAPARDRAARLEVLPALHPAGLRRGGPGEWTRAVLDRRPPALRVVRRLGQPEGRGRLPRGVPRPRDREGGRRRRLSRGARGAREADRREARAAHRRRHRPPHRRPRALGPRVGRPGADLGRLGARPQGQPALHHRAARAPPQGRLGRAPRGGRAARRGDGEVGPAPPGVAARPKR